MSRSHDVVIVGGGIAGCVLATVLARNGIPVTVLEHDAEPPDRVRGEWLAPWGAIELAKLGLLDTLHRAGGVFCDRSVPYDENSPGDEALAHEFRFSSVVKEVPGSFCMGHPAMCRALASAAEAAGATLLRGVENLEVKEGASPTVSFAQDGIRTEWRPQLVIGADGRNSRVRHQLGIPMHIDAPHNLLGGMLVDGVPGWPQDILVIGTEGRTHFLIFPQGGDRLRLYLCYDFADKTPFAGPQRRQNLIDSFSRLACLPQAELIAAARPIGPFNSFSNEDHWTDDPTAPGCVLVGDAAGHNDPIIGQGLAIAMRDARLVSEIILDGRRSRDDFRSYVEERRERMRRLRIAAHFVALVRAEFGEEARQRRARAMRRIRIDKMPSPNAAAVVGPDRLPASVFEQSTMDALLA